MESLKYGIRSISLGLILTCAAALTLAGCVPVAPYERGTLASRRMTLDGRPAQQVMTQARLKTREEGHIGASGASGSGGAGGCGCN